MEKDYFTWDPYSRAIDKHKNVDLPLVTIVIPTCNSAQTIGLTLESVLGQDYHSFELIIIDNSTDRTLEIVRDFKSDKIKIFSASKCQRYEALNKGLSQSNGEYINFLFPGDFYIYHQTLKQMMTLAIEKEKPELVYCGTLLRDGYSEAKLLFRNFSLESLKKGEQPTSLQSCWFKATAIKSLGKFNSNLSLRGGFDLMVRFALQKNFRFASIKRFLVDYDLRQVTRQMVLTHFWETAQILNSYFGLWIMLRWLLFYQKDWKRFLKLWFRSFKIAFSGR